jgi:hypothetical protein
VQDWDQVLLRHNKKKRHPVSILKTYYVEKINYKRKSRAYKVSGWISADHSCACPVFMPFISPSKVSKCKCFFFSPPLHIFATAYWVTKSGTMGTTSTGLGRKEQGGLPCVDPLDLRAQARRPITEVVQKIIIESNLINSVSRDRVRVRYYRN